VYIIVQKSIIKLCSACTYVNTSVIKCFHSMKSEELMKSVVVDEEEKVEEK
jgi:hypothetical protein